MSSVPALLTADNEIHGLAILLNHILASGNRNGPYLEVLGCLLSIGFDELKWNLYRDCREQYLTLGGELCRGGWTRATRVYTKVDDRPSKPSYLNRLIAYPDKTRKKVSPRKGLNQIEKISEELARKPGFSNLSFVILRPADLHDQFRPGYVPCAIAGDFKYRKEKLELNVMFRTNDALAVGYADIYYMRCLQLEVLELAKKINPRLKNASIGRLNMYFCRSYIARMAKSKTGKRIDGLKAARAVLNSLQSLAR